ncbi:hypothetical protein RCF19_30010 [Rhodococcus qingshengii]
MILTEFDLAELIDDALLQEQEPIDIARAILAGGVKLPSAPRSKHHGDDPWTTTSEIKHICTDFSIYHNDAYGRYRRCDECGEPTNPNGGEL